MGRQGELNNESIHLVIVVESIHYRQEFILADIGREPKQPGLEANLSTGLDFVRDIRFTASIVPHQNGRQQRGSLTCRPALAVGHLQFFSNLSGRSFAVKK
jgi:hypothetical protein